MNVEGFVVSEVREVIVGFDAAVIDLVKMVLVGDNEVDGVFVGALATSMGPRASAGKMAVDDG